MPFYPAVERNLARKIPWAWTQSGVPCNRWIDISGRFWDSWVCDYAPDSCCKLCCSIICHVSELLGVHVIQMIMVHIEHHECMQTLLRNAPGRSFTKLSCSQLYFWGLTGQRPAQGPLRHDLPQKVHDSEQPFTLLEFQVMKHMNHILRQGPVHWKLFTHLQTKWYISIFHTSSENEQGPKQLIYTKCAQNFWYQIHSWGQEYIRINISRQSDQEYSTNFSSNKRISGYFCGCWVVKWVTSQI